MLGQCPVSALGLDLRGAMNYYRPLDNTMNTSKARLLDVDTAKGLTIMLVVLGHITTYSHYPIGNDWYMGFKDVVYKFHMAFFFYLAGITYCISWQNKMDYRFYKNFVVKKISKFLPSYLLITVIVIFGKVVGNYLGLYIDNNPTSIIDILRVFYDPKHSVIGFLWFMYTLLQIYLLSLMLFMVTDNGIVFLVITFALGLLPMTSFMGLDYLCSFLKYFAIGYFVYDHYDYYLSLIDRYSLLVIVAFLLLLLISYRLKVSILVISLFSLPALHATVRSIRFSWLSALSKLGKYSYTIYLLHMIFMGIAKAIIMKIVPFGGNCFPFIVVILTLVGLTFPIYFKEVLLIRSKTLYSMF
jgi:fucose 4-O-acetylase-like acetyltransferase